MRRVWAGLVLVAWAGVAPAQPPQPAGDILVQKTAGQPERRLKLLRIDTGPDGQRMADVQDLTTGARYTLPASALAGMRREAAPANPVSGTPQAVKQQVAPNGKFPTSLPLPEPSPGGYSPFASRQLTPTPEPRAKPKAGWAAAPPPAEPAKPVALDTPLTAVVAAPAKPVEPPTPLTRTTRVTELPPFSLPTPMPGPLPEPPPPPDTPAVVRLAIPDRAPPRPVQYTAPAVAPWQMSRSEQMRAEIEPYTNDLANALRPSARERAATTLANCRHASQPEVKQLLARTAMTDPAPSVQAHCVSILSTLGYHERDYVEFLEVSLGSDNTPLRQAASAALAKLAPR